MTIRHRVQRWRLLALILPVVLIVTGISVVQFSQATSASAAPPLPPDLGKWQTDARARLIGMPGTTSTRSAARNGYQVLCFEYTLPSGEGTGVAVYPGVVYDTVNGGLLTNSRWPAKEASGQDAQDFVTRMWGELDEIASNPEGLRLLKSIGKASPLAGKDGEPAFGFHNPSDTSGSPSPVKTLITRAARGGEYKAVKMNGARGAIDLKNPWILEGTGTGANIITVPDHHIVGAYTDKGRPFGMRPATTLAHEMIHTLNGLTGITPIEGARNDPVKAEYLVHDPKKTGILEGDEGWIVSTNVEELVTHGGKAGLKGAFGTKVLGGPKANPYAVRSVVIATAAKKANPGDQVLERTLEVRSDLAARPISETSFVKASAISQSHRPTYNQPQDLPNIDFELAPGKSWADLKPADYTEPGNSSALVEKSKAPSAGGAACGGGAPASGCVYSERRATAKEIKESAEFEAADKAGKALPESAESRIIADLPPDQLPTYAEARVRHAMAEYEAAPSKFGPGEFGFTSDLTVAMKNPAAIFQPFGGATSVKGAAPARLSKSLTKGWGTLNTAMTPAMAHMWINSITEAFGQDTSDLTKSAVVMAPVPVVGQLLGIADSVERKDGVGLTVNVLYLLAEASDFAGQPELAMLFGVVALATQIVAGIVDWANGRSEADKQIEGRNTAWHDTMKKDVINKSIPALLSAARKAFDAAQQKLMFGAYATMAQLNVTAEKSGSSVVMEAARTANALTMANAKASVESLRSGFINGVHQAVIELFGSLNKGTGSDVFTKAYLDKAAFPAWYENTWKPNRPKCAGNGMPFGPCPNDWTSTRRARVDWERDVVPGVLANTPKDFFTAGDLKDVQGAVDGQLSGGKMFAPRPITDTTPVAPIGFLPCADDGGTCAGIEGRTGQVAFGAAGKYVTAPLPPGGIACKPSSFPTDPNPSAHKSCFVPAGDNTSGGDGGSWLSSVGGCADEGEKCTVSGTQEVAFGAGAHWIVKPVTSSVVCDSSEKGFGADPAPGRAKECRVLAGSPPGQAANAGGPYQACAVQGEDCHVTGRVRLAFGAHVSDDERKWAYKVVDGDAYPNGVPCTTSTFGEDPLPGDAEGCYIANPPAPFTFCSVPGGTCSVPESGAYQMAYGGDGAWTVKTVPAGDVACNDATFGDAAIPTSNDLRGGTRRNYCYLSGTNHDLVLGGETQHETSSVHSDWESDACARPGQPCKVNGSTVLAYGTYLAGRGTYLVKPLTPRADQSAINCDFAGFTPRDPQLNDAHCFLLTTPTLGFDTTQTDFVYRETKRTNPPASPTAPGPGVPDPHGEHGKAFSSGFEPDDTKPTWTDSVDENRGGVDNVAGRNGGPGPVASLRTGERAHTGDGSLLYSGSTGGGRHAHAYLKVFDLADKPVSIGKARTLSYWIYPKSADRWDNADWPVDNSSCVALDLVFTDGTTLRDSGAVDQKGNSTAPAAQCGHLKPNEWNHITVNLAGKNNDKEISRINLGYDQNYPGNATYSGYIDDIRIS